MIHIVEVPWQGRPLAWFAFDEDNLVGKIRVRCADPERRHARIIDGMSENGEHRGCAGL